jgi:hypothetical protein
LVEERPDTLPSEHLAGLSSVELLPRDGEGSTQFEESRFPETTEDATEQVAVSLVDDMLATAVSNLHVCASNAIDGGYESDTLLSEDEFETTNSVNAIEDSQQVRSLISDALVGHDKSSFVLLCSVLSDPMQRTLIAPFVSKIIESILEHQNDILVRIGTINAWCGLFV